MTKLLAIAFLGGMLVMALIFIGWAIQEAERFFVESAGEGPWPKGDKS